MDIPSLLEHQAPVLVQRLNTLVQCGCTGLSGGSITLAAGTQAAGENGGLTVTVAPAQGVLFARDHVAWGQLVAGLAPGPHPRRVPIQLNALPFFLVFLAPFAWGGWPRERVAHLWLDNEAGNPRYSVVWGASAPVGQALDPTDAEYAEFAATHVAPLAYDFDMAARVVRWRVTRTAETTVTIAQDFSWRSRARGLTPLITDPEEFTG